MKPLVIIDYMSLLNTEMNREKAEMVDRATQIALDCHKKYSPNYRFIP